jgi:molybdate transport system substrate-binding protein
MQIKVLSTHAVVEVLRELVPDFERQNGAKLCLAYNPAAVIKREIAAGAAFDIAIVTRSVLDELIAQGSIIRETCRNLARCGLGLAVRAGAPKPDISTVENFKRALLAAKSIVRSRDGTSGQYFEGLLDHLGIGDKVRPKIVIGLAGRIAELVARGKAEMAVQQVPELVPVKGTDFVAPFPTELQLSTDFAVGVATSSKVREAAQAFVDLLAAPSSAPLFKAKGLEPIAS